MNVQADFSAALRDPSQAVPAGLRSWNGSDPQTRFAVHRNNFVVSLIDALADAYPVCQELVGEEFFSAMARVFVQTQPPRTRILVNALDGFPSFIGSFAPAQSLPYLADVARLEMLRGLAYHAADAQPIDPAALAQVFADLSELSALGLSLHPSLHAFASSFAIVSIWSAHQGLQSLSSVDTEVAEAALIFRADLQVQLVPVSAADAGFVQRIMAGAALPLAAADALDQNPQFDLSRLLALLIRNQWVIGVHRGDISHE